MTTSKLHTPRDRKPRLFKLLLPALVTLGLAPGGAKAWDVGTTHLDLSELALLESQTHRAWMDASGMRRGLFSRLSIKPQDLGPIQRWELEQSIAKSPGRAMVRPRGGEPMCPPEKNGKPKAGCQERRPWSQDALGWLRLGVLTATHSPHLMLRHVALPLPGQSREAPRWFRVAQRRRNHAPYATVLAGSTIRENGPLQALQERRGWSLGNLAGTMAASAIAPDPTQREQALVESLILWGIALHLVQDQTLPANARGELAGLFEPLSEHRYDRGSALAQWARQSMQRVDLDVLAQTCALPASLAKMNTWEALLSRSSNQPSLPRWVSRHFLSPGAFPRPRRVNWKLDPTQAANELLSGVNLHLRAAERDGLVLLDWPAPAGYLTTASNRILASYTRGGDGMVTLAEDPAVFAENGAQLLSLAMAASLHLLNRAFSLPPQGVSDPTQNRDWREQWSKPRVLMLREDANGQRKVIQRWNDSLPNDQALLEAQRKASAPEALPIFVVYEGDAKRLPRLLQWRLPAVTQSR